jgi:hypothetical protein
MAGKLASVGARIETVTVDEDSGVSGHSYE